MNCFLDRATFAADAEEAASAILADIRHRGEPAIREAAARFDGVALDGPLAVAAGTPRAGQANTTPGLAAALRAARSRVAAFARAGLRKDWSRKTPGGGVVGERFLPFDRVGVYVPGGAAPLVSTVIMTVTLARVAGVPEIVVCTPPGRDGTINPDLLLAMSMAGASEVYRVGGIQAIGLMAYGAGPVRPVQKIVGPGGAFVTAAKRQVYGRVALDLVAGPSEIAVLADDSPPASWVAADLLSQVEHGTGHERALLVTTSRRLARAVAVELPRQAARLSRSSFLQSVLRSNVRIAQVGSLDEGVELCNRFAPEHLELLTRQPSRWVKKIRHAGAVFVGPWTPEAVGDFVAGPSHVLPTGGAARLFSGLTVDDFRRRTSVVRFTRADLAATLPVIQTFGRVEGLDGHARSAAIRFDANA